MLTLLKIDSPNPTFINSSLLSLKPHSSLPSSKLNYLPSVVINLSSLNLDPSTILFLEKDLIYYIVPRPIHHSSSWKGFNLLYCSPMCSCWRFIFSINSIKHHLIINDVEECGRVFHRVRIPKPNLCKEEFQSIWKINDNLVVIILKYDNKIATIIINNLSPFSC